MTVHVLQSCDIYTYVPTRRETNFPNQRLPSLFLHPTSRRKSNIFSLEDTICNSGSWSPLLLPRSRRRFSCGKRSRLWFETTPFVGNNKYLDHSLIYICWKCYICWKYYICWRYYICRIGLQPGKLARVVISVPTLTWNVLFSSSNLACIKWEVSLLIGKMLWCLFIRISKEKTHSEHSIFLKHSITIRIQDTRLNRFREAPRRN